MTSPTNSNSNQKPFDHPFQNDLCQNQNTQSSLYFTKVRPTLATVGHIFSDMGGPVMTAGFFHGFLRYVSEDYLRVVKRYPSGSSIILTGLALKIMGNSFVDNYSNKPLLNSATVKIGLANHKEEATEKKLEKN